MPVRPAGRKKAETLCQGTEAAALLRGIIAVVYLKPVKPKAREAPDLPVRKQETVARNSPGMRNNDNAARLFHGGDHRLYIRRKHRNIIWAVRTDDPRKRSRTVRIDTCLNKGICNMGTPDGSILTVPDLRPDTLPRYRIIARDPVNHRPDALLSYPARLRKKAQGSFIFAAEQVCQYVDTCFA